MFRGACPERRGWVRRPYWEEEVAEKRAGQDGFTLLEILVALVLMAVGVTLILQLFSANLRNIFVSGNMTAIVVKAESRLREITSGRTLAEGAWNETTEEGYRLDVAIAEVLKDRTDNLPIKLMEVNLTVYWREGWKEKSIRLKTIRMIDKAVTQESGPATSG